jgi:hypothetical protein
MFPSAWQRASPCLRFPEADKVWEQLIEALLYVSVLQHKDK